MQTCTHPPINCYSHTAPPPFTELGESNRTVYKPANMLTVMSTIFAFLINIHPSEQGGQRPPTPPWRHPCCPTGHRSTPLHSLRPNRPLSKRGNHQVAICNQSCPDQGRVSQNKPLHMFSIVLVPRAHERKEGGVEVSIRGDSGASNPHEDHILLLAPTALKDTRRLSEEPVPGDPCASGNNE